MRPPAAFTRGTHVPFGLLRPLTLTQKIEYFIISMILQRAHLPEGPAVWVRNMGM